MDDPQLEATVARYLREQYGSRNGPHGRWETAPARWATSRSRWQGAWRQALTGFAAVVVALVVVGALVLRPPSQPVAVAPSDTAEPSASALPPSPSAEATSEPSPSVTSEPSGSPAGATVYVSGTSRGHCGEGGCSYVVSLAPLAGQGATIERELSVGTFPSVDLGATEPISSVAPGPYRFTAQAVIMSDVCIGEPGDPGCFEPIAEASRCSLDVQIAAADVLAVADVRYTQDSCAISFGPSTQPPDAASWELSPDAPLDRTAVEVPVLVTERACASGRPATGRIAAPAITYGPAEIEVALAVARLPGDQECPGNPPTSFTLVLTEPLGPRALVDAGGEEPRTIVDAGR